MQLQTPNQKIESMAGSITDLLTMKQADDDKPRAQYIRATNDVTALANSIAGSETSEETWWIECGKMGISLPDLVTGAFWHYTEYHNGQESPGYAALSALGRVYSPGMEAPDPDNEIYQALSALAEKGRH